MYNNLYQKFKNVQESLSNEESKNNILINDLTNYEIHLGFFDKIKEKYEVLLK